MVPKRFFSLKKYTTIFITAIVLSLYGVFIVFAAAPSGGYNPGSTLDPDCAPGDVDCIVALPSGGSVTADNGLTATGTNVQLGGTLVQNTSIDQAGFDFSLTKDSTTSLVSTSTIPGIGDSGIGFSHNETDITSFNGLLDDVVPFIFLNAQVPGGQLFRKMSFGEPSGIELVNILVNDWSTLQLNGNNIALKHENTSNGMFGEINIFPASGSTASDHQIQFRTELGSYAFPRADGLANQVLTTDGAGQLSWQNAGGGSGWSLTGNSGTTAGTNFIGTTDAQDFVIKTNGNEIIRLLTDGSFAANGGVATEGSFAWGKNAVAQSTSFAFSTGNYANALGSESWALGSGVDAYADYSIALGKDVGSYSIGEISLGFNNTEYMPVSADSFNTWYLGDRLFNIGNGGLGSEHNAYTLWKDGSFAYNDDNFQNDNPGTEQNMFYFNYGNHDGLGAAQTKRAIRLGSVGSTEWDINDSNVGASSIAIGFVNNNDGFPTSLASGENSIAIGDATFAIGYDSRVFGSDGATASGGNSVAIGDGAQATGEISIALSRGTASGNFSLAAGTNMEAFSFGETAFGLFGTSYMPASANDQAASYAGGDRLFSIGNGQTAFALSDALTILKNGQTGIGIDNFEANTNGNIFQVGDGTTNIIGYVDDVTGNWVAVSDERKKDNITDLSYGLNELLQLRPTSFNYKRNGEHTIGFIAQQVLPIIPEAVYGSESEGYGMSYATLTPVLVKAIQEMNLNITMLSDTARPNTWREALIAWFESTTNGIRSLVVKDKICVDNECLTKDDIHALLQLKNQTIPPAINIYPVGPNNPPVTPPDSGTPPLDDNSGGTPSEPVPPSEPTPPDSGSNPSLNVGTSE